MAFSEVDLKNIEIEALSNEPVTIDQILNKCMAQKYGQNCKH